MAALGKKVVDLKAVVAKLFDVIIMSSISIDETIDQDRFRKRTLCSHMFAFNSDQRRDSHDALSLHFYV